MRASFDRRIDVALDDLRLQDTLAATTFRFVELRDRAAQGLPEWEQLREQANAIKRHTIENLSHYLQQLEAGVLDRGGHVFWAADGEQACAYIAELARARQVRLVVKSKSMLSEEIELNHALERQGIEAVETDLGEYIIQLAGEKPSHIIAPAIHKTRKEVADLFEQKLGLPRTEEIPKLTATARRILRQKFLTAGMGVTGANFAVAETGSLVLVENEGNIRFCSSVPRLHVAVMGIEKVIPRMADLAVFLRLIARSGTGQKLTSYVSVLSGARRASEPDGPAEFHLVLLDNGAHPRAGRPAAARGALLHSLRSLSQCLPCLPQDRRARVSGGVFGAHRRHSDTADSRPGRRTQAPLRLLAVRRLPRRLSGEDPHPGIAAGPAAPGDRIGRGAPPTGEADFPRVGVGDGTAPPV